MPTIQMTLDNELVQSVDKVVKELKTTRSVFTRDALRDAINSLNVCILEEKHRMGYKLHPVNSSEFSVWEEGQNWGNFLFSPPPMTRKPRSSGPHPRHPRRSRQPSRPPSRTRN